ncbi:hypothetical protein ACWDA3_21840 [Nonomuraea rubra]
MRNSITFADYELAIDQCEYETFDDDGNPVMRMTGRSTLWCSYGQPHGY